MPVFGSTVHAVITMSKSDETTIPELTRVILQDSAMTTRVLKLANTIFYNPNIKSISTVSRAIVLLGMKAVSNICLTIKLVDALMEGICHDRLVKEMGLSIHAAVQARSIAQQRGDKEPEEVFIASLLMRLGRMAFWCFGDETAKALDKALNVPGVDPEKEEKALLGFPLKSLTQSLAKEWGLGDLLCTALNSSTENSAPRAKNVVLSSGLADVVVEQGWKSESIEKLMEELAEFLGQPVETVSTLLQESAKNAAVIACTYGAQAAAMAIPIPPEYELEIQDEHSTIEEEFQVGDPMLQLDILREIKGVLYERPSFNVLLEMIMEGIYRGIGMDRVLFALLAPDYTAMKAKYVLGVKHELLASSFEFVLNQDEPNIFMYVINKKRPVWVKPGNAFELSDLVTCPITEVIGEGGFLVAPLIIDNKVIGIIYADRIPSGRALNEETLKGFEHFCAEANMGLEFIARRGTS